MKQEFSEKFKEIYKGKRLLAVQLNGFNHTLFYDNGDGDSEVEIDRFSLYTKMGTDKAQKLFENLSLDYHYKFKHEPEEILFLTPEER